MPRLRLIVVALAGTFAGGDPAFAHRFTLFASADGTTITGSARFAGGGTPAGETVVAHDPAGRELARTTTDADGAFSLEATQRIDHHLVIETADGHVARFVVSAAELPASLPTRDGPAVDAPADAAMAAVGGDAPAATLPASIDEAALAALVDEAVRRRVQPLREELFAFQEAVRFRDVLGGIGYIVGFFGLIAYGLSLRRRPPQRLPDRRADATALGGDDRAAAG